MTPSYISADLRRQVAEDAGHRCGYCLTDEALSGIPLTLDHVVPVAAGGPNTRDNLWLACRPCNEFKAAQTQAVDPQTGQSAPLFNPRAQVWHEHFSWNTDQTEVRGLTATGRATVSALQINRPMLVRARRRWHLAGWQPLS
jgi:hypothetical protein